ncbi:Uncharacterized protein HZ326_21369 [Fusarium oxysporum f. sp. albedinis]|nr:Uncharacterized protein HZ326_21369 [Fusarium oxysporum f. sp. albedinis]
MSSVPKQPDRAVYVAQVFTSSFRCGFKCGDEGFIRWPEKEGLKGEIDDVADTADAVFFWGHSRSTTHH